MPGTLFVVATPIGNLEDITVRALRVLREVSVIAAEDTRRTAHLLARHAIETPMTSLHEHNEAGKSRALIDRLQRGESVAVVSDAGTPTVSDPGGLLIRSARDAGLKVEAVPGPSALLAALSSSGLPTDSFTFLGFPPSRGKDRKLWFERLQAVRGTIVFFEAPHRIEQTLGEILGAVGDCEAVICRELTKAHEESVKGPISTLFKQMTALRGEFTVVLNVGHTPDITGRDTDQAPAVVKYFGELTTNNGMARRMAIQMVAKRHGIKPNKVYEMIEAAKNSG
jgi:16S rRNA (cytidine1402-2'-O)-methyltransferase